jgi:hypothetical protein
MVLFCRDRGYIVPSGQPILLIRPRVHRSVFYRTTSYLEKGTYQYRFQHLVIEISRYVYIIPVLIYNTDIVETLL